MNLNDFASLFSLPGSLVTAVFGYAKSALGWAPYKSVLENVSRTYQVNGEELAKLYFQNGVTHIDINSADPIIRGAALAELTGNEFIEFYKHYISVLPGVARVLAGPFSKEPINFISSEIDRRDIKFDDYDNKMFAAYVEGINKQIQGIHDNSMLPNFLLPDFFTVDQFKAFASFGDVYKGVGCSTAVRIDGHSIEFIRNLDWASLGELGNNTVMISYLTGHDELDKPHKVYSLTPLPGMFGLTAWNDHGLIMALNEVTKMDTKRENPAGGITEFRIIEKILNECSTLDQAVTMLKTSLTPATSHILTIASVNEGMGAVIDILSTDVEDLIRVRPMTGDEDYKIVFTTNHFVDAEGHTIYGSEGFSDSYERYNAMNQSLQNHLAAKEVAKSVEAVDTVHTVIMHATVGDLDSMHIVAAIDNAFAPSAHYMDIF